MTISATTGSDEPNSTACAHFNIATQSTLLRRSTSHARCSESRHRTASECIAELMEYREDCSAAVDTDSTSTSNTGPRADDGTSRLAGKIQKQQFRVTPPGHSDSSARAAMAAQVSCTKTTTNGRARTAEALDDGNLGVP